MPTYTKNQIGIELTPEVFHDLLNNTKGGLFASVRNYVNQEGEIATHCFQVGVDYGKVVKRSVEKVQSWIAIGSLEIDNLQVKYNTYVDAQGNEYNRAKKDERWSTEKNLTLAGNDTLVLVALREILADLTKPASEKQQGAEYSKEAKSLYSLEQTRDQTTVYLRDCLTVGKRVHKQGNYEVKHTTAPIAIRNAIKRLLPVGKYRQYIVTNFDSLTLDGISLMVDETGQAYQTTPDLAKQIGTPEIVESVAVNIPQDEIAEPVH